MNDTEQGMVIPFRLPSSRMRRSAETYRRHGQVLDALALVRKAAQQDDTADGWQALAAELRQMACWEAASAILGRVLSRPDHAPSAWLDMARCMSAQGQLELAQDCVYHLLQEDPWSPEADAARAMLPDLEEGEAKEPRRVTLLIQRGLRAWYEGDKVLCDRRIRRAVRLTSKKERLMVTMALMHMMRWDFPGAMAWLSAALRMDPASPRALCTASAVFQQMGKARIARAFLRKAMPYCQDTRLEEQFLTAAWAVDDWPAMRRYLDMQLRRYPHRVTLLNAKATLLYEQGDVAGAQQCWRQTLSIDPTDRRALELLTWTQTGERAPLPMPGKRPKAEQTRQQALLEGAEDLFTPGSEARTVLDWFAASPDITEQRLALEAAAKKDDPAAEIRFLQEVIARPGVQLETCQRALMRLAEMNVTDSMTMLAGDRYTAVQCQKTEKPTRRRLWRLYLPMLLTETRRYGMSEDIAQFAASIWEAMTPDQRRHAATSGGYLWCKAMEVLWLRMTGQEERAVRLVRKLPVSARRISRVLRQIGRNMQTEPANPAKENKDEVH